MLPTVEEINAALKKLNYNQPIPLTQSRLKELLSYDPTTGFFIRKIDYSCGKAGALAGAKKNGYLSIMLDRKEYFAHRLAWLYEYGYFPENDIDHINRIKTDNRIDNLREVSKACNRVNSKQNSNNTSGITGISFIKARSTWRSSIKINGKSYNLGSFIDYAEAVCFRLAAEQCLDWAGCDSDSPAYRYVQEHIINKGVCNENNRI